MLLAEASNLERQAEALGTAGADAVTPVEQRQQERQPQQTRTTDPKKFGKVDRPAMQRDQPNISPEKNPAGVDGAKATFQNIENMHASSQVASLAYRFSQSGLCIASRRTWPVVACPVMNTDSV